MSDTVYARLADALNALPNGFPRTQSGVELRILEYIYTPEEAALAGLLTREWETIDAIAERTGLSRKEARKQLVQMARKGQVWMYGEEGALRARLAAFIVGVYEAQLDRLEHEFVHLMERYLNEEGGVQGIMGPEPALQRVMPAHAALAVERILPYDDVRAVLLAAKSFHVRDCICRAEQDVLGTRQCDFPLEACLSFSSQERPLGEGDLTQEQALALLDRCEEIGLVHSVSNLREGIGYVCNCCGCCCGLLRGINLHGVKGAMARASYYAVIDPDACQGCGVCVERCQVHAIALEGDFAVVDRVRCLGCGLCVTGCPHQVARLERLPEAEITPPPLGWAEWESARLHNRGIIS